MFHFGTGQGLSQNSMGTQPLFGGQRHTYGPVPVTGTPIKFSPKLDTDTMLKQNAAENIKTKHQVITAMREYETKSMEELRLEDYAANRKNGHTTQSCGFNVWTCSTQGQQQQQQQPNNPFLASTSGSSFSRPSVFNSTGSSATAVSFFGQGPNSSGNIFMPNVFGRPVSSPIRFSAIQLPGTHFGNIEPRRRLAVTPKSKPVKGNIFSSPPDGSTAIATAGVSAVSASGDGQDWHPTEMDIISFINKIDFTKEFKRWHVTWHFETINSACSNIDIKLGDRDKIVVPMRLETEVKDGKTSVYLRPSWGMTASPIPILYRISFTSAGEGLQHEETGFCVLFRESSMCHLIGESAVPVEKDVTLHVWIDIPSSIDQSAKYNPPKSSNDENESLQEKSLDALIKNFARTLQDEVLKTTDIGNNSSSDVSLVVIDDELKLETRRFPCHRIILSSNSPWFNRLFADAVWKNNAKDDGGVVEIDDFSEQTVEHLLTYIYTSRLPNVQAPLMELARAAHKYELPHLKEFCVSAMISYANKDDDRIKQLVFADEHQILNLKAVCIAQLASNWTEVYKKSRTDRNMLSGALLAEIMDEAGKRHYDTKEIVF